MSCLILSSNMCCTRLLFQGAALGSHPLIILSQLLQELLIIPNYPLSHRCHNIFLPHEGLQGFVGIRGCNYPPQQQGGSAGKARDHLWRGFCKNLGVPRGFQAQLFLLPTAFHAR